MNSGPRSDLGFGCNAYPLEAVAASREPFRKDLVASGGFERGFECGPGKEGCEDAKMRRGCEVPSKVLDTRPS